MIRDQNGNPVTVDPRQHPDGTWSARVWETLAGMAYNIRRNYGYISRAAAKAADISESVEETNRKYRER